MRIAIVGCGYVADFYVRTLRFHQNLQLVGVTDRDQQRAEGFSAQYSAPAFGSIAELLAEPGVELVVNLTNPASHAQVTRACLEAGKHVYTEKPLAMSFGEAKELVEIAESRGLLISSAPSRVLGETAQTFWKAIRANAVGTIRLVYAEMDDGLVHKMPYTKWVSESGAPWPYKDEFEVGCTLEHAAYAVTWLTAFFGPAETVTAFSSCLIRDKQTDVPLDTDAPDFSVASIRFVSGVVGRLTCSIIAPPNHSLRVFGDDGVLYTEDCWRPRCPVYVRKRLTLRRRALISPWKQRYPMVRPAFGSPRLRRFKKVDFCLGISEMANAIDEQRPCRLSPKYCLHVTEVVLAIHHALESATTYRVTTGFDAMDPMPWAKA